MYATIVVCPTNRDAQRDATCYSMMQGGTRALIPPTSKINCKIRTWPFFKLIAMSNLIGRQVCRQLDRKDSICIFPICRYASIRMGNAPEKAMGGLEGCELPDRDVPQVISTTLKASIGRCKPLSVSSPTGSAVALPSRAARTLPSIKIWPSRASEQRRAARLTTVPIAL